MPIIAFECENKHPHKMFFRSVKDIPAQYMCGECGFPFRRLLSAPSSESKVTVDNGFQARAVEVNPDIIAINKERSNKDYRNED